MAVLVTGGAGYIGSHVALALMDAGEEVVVLDDLSRGVRDNVPRGALFVRGSVGDSFALNELFAMHDIRAVMHLAAYVSVPESLRAPLLYYRNNRDTTYTLILVAIKHRVRHFVFSSTAAVYGELHTIPVPEDAPCEPINPYGNSKLQAEQELRTLGRHFAGWSALRYFNVAGADPMGRAGYQVSLDAGHLIRRALLVATGQVESLEVFGTDYPTKDGTAVRDYVHVCDIAAAHVQVLNYLRRGGTRIFNIGYGHGYSVLEVVEAVRRVTGRAVPVHLSPRRRGDAAQVVADVRRIKRELDWHPHFDDLETIIKHEYEWVRTHLPQ